MSARISDVFGRLQTDGRTGLVAYVTGGDPDLARSADILRAIDRGGADVIEVGVPFSDPLADGPVIQRASERALAAGVNLTNVLELVADVRQELSAAVVLFTYANPVLRMGTAAFTARAASAGVDGVLMLDLPIEEAGPFRQAVVDAGMDPIFLVSPTTTDARLREAGVLGQGFLYGISRLGVTGARAQVASGASALVQRIRAASALPVAVGFGLSRPEHVQEIGRYADAAVVGSALVNMIAEVADTPDLIPAVERYVRWLRRDIVPGTRGDETAV